MDAQHRQWQAILARLEASLEQLQLRGVRYLNVAEHPAFAEQLRAHLGADASIAVNGAAPPDGDLAGPARGASAAGRAAGLAKRLKGGTPTPREERAPAAEVAPGAGAGPAAEAPPVGEIPTLESLFFHFRNCMACGLGATRNRLVFGVGDAKARLLFIGEGPGAEEDQQGLPFVGRAGALLTGLIQALGLTRDDVYITNVVKCRPPGNRNPEAGEAAACRPILMRQIELIDPALIVTLGNVPLKALNPGAGGITRERGRLFAFQKWQVLPTFHPSYLLRSPAGIKECWADFKQARQLAYPGPTG